MPGVYFWTDIVVWLGKGEGWSVQVVKVGVMMVVFGG